MLGLLWFSVLQIPVVLGLLWMTGKGAFSEPDGLAFFPTVGVIEAIILVIALLLSALERR